MFRIVVQDPGKRRYYLTEEGGLCYLHTGLHKRFPTVESAWIRIEQVRGRYKGFNLLFHVECEVCADWDPNEEDLPPHECMDGWHTGVQTAWDILGFHTKS